MIYLIKGNRQRVDRALVTHIPHIYKELRESMESLVDLQDRLPLIRSQVNAIRAAYESGRVKVSHLPLSVNIPSGAYMLMISIS